MYDEIGFLLAIKEILDGYFVSKKNPRYVSDMVEWLSERWSCHTQPELLERVVLRLKELQD